jgi:hypothetical protein
MCPQVQADNIYFDRTDFVAEEVHIERYTSEGWARFFCNQCTTQPLQLQMSPYCYDLAAVPFFPTTSCRTCGIPFLAFRMNKSKLLCTIKMLSDLFHSDPEGPEAIYR